MIDISAGTEDLGTPIGDVFSMKLRVGYCVDCGTWDQHGRFCAACGYDFAPPTASVPGEPSA